MPPPAFLERRAYEKSNMTPNGHVREGVGVLQSHSIRRSSTLPTLTGAILPPIFLGIAS